MVDKSVDIVFLTGLVRKSNIWKMAAALGSKSLSLFSNISKKFIIETQISITQFYSFLPPAHQFESNFNWLNIWISRGRILKILWSDNFEPSKNGAAPVNTIREKLRLLLSRLYSNNFVFKTAILNLA